MHRTVATKTISIYYEPDNERHIPQLGYGQESVRNLEIPFLRYQPVYHNETGEPIIDRANGRPVEIEKDGKTVTIMQKHEVLFDSDVLVLGPGTNYNIPISKWKEAKKLDLVKSRINSGSLVEFVPTKSGATTLQSYAASTARQMIESTWNLTQLQTFLDQETDPTIRQTVANRMEDLRKGNQQLAAQAQQQQNMKYA